MVPVLLSEKLTPRGRRARRPSQRSTMPFEASLRSPVALTSATCEVRCVAGFAIITEACIDVKDRACGDVTTVDGAPPAQSASPSWARDEMFPDQRPDLTAASGVVGGRGAHARSRLQ